jgi:hypothetical protein
MFCSLKSKSLPQQAFFLLFSAVRIFSEMGIFAVRVDVIDQDSKDFYLHYGFVPFQDAQFSLLLPKRNYFTQLSRI